MKSRATMLAWFCAAVLGCSDVEESDGGSDEGTASCMHGEFSECACPDGSMGQQLCAHDTSGFEPCVCGSGDDGSSAGETLPGDAESAGPGDTGVDPGASTDDGSPGTTSSDSTTSGSETAPIGEPPTATINHPGTEDRQVGVPIPFAGTATDPEDGPLSGASLVWSDSLEGPIGEGEAFEAALNELGEHTVTLTATDADGNVGEASLTFTIVP